MRGWEDITVSTENLIVYNPFTSVVCRVSKARFPFKRNRLRCGVASNENFTQQTQAPANRNARSKQWQPWLAACQRKRLRFLRFSFSNARNASDCVWMETELYTGLQWSLCPVWWHTGYRTDRYVRDPRPCPCCKATSRDWILMSPCRTVKDISSSIDQNYRSHNSLRTGISSSLLSSSSLNY